MHRFGDAGLVVFPGGFPVGDGGLGGEGGGEDEGGGEAGGGEVGGGVGG